MFVKNIHQQKIIDFLNYKNENELIYCTFYQTDEEKTNKSKVVWTTTKKYSNNFSSIGDIEKINQQLLLIKCGENVVGVISKITCSENCYIVEFSFYPKY